MFTYNFTHIWEELCSSDVEATTFDAPSNFLSILSDDVLLLVILAEELDTDAGGGMDVDGEGDALTGDGAWGSISVNFFIWCITP